MAFHIPPSGSWEPARICSEICVRGWCARVVANEVMISAPRLPRTTKTWICSRLLGRPEITLQYIPHRFLINVEIVWNTLRHNRLFDQCYDAIYDSLTGLGYLEACTDYTERELALRYCHANFRLLQILDKIEDLQREKEELMKRRDYQLAVQKQDAAHALQLEVDALLFSSWAGR